MLSVGPSENVRVTGVPGETVKMNMYMEYPSRPAMLIIITAL